MKKNFNSYDYRGGKLKAYNTCCKVSNYCTGELEEVLNQYSDYGFNLVSTLIAKNECDIDVMYLFFTKVCE